MSYAPPYTPNGPPPNPDRRELPPGWTEQYDYNYKAWFYVNTRENPPRSSWQHPLGPPQQGYAPPPMPPPENRGYNSSPYAQGGYNQGPPQQQWGSGGGYPGAAPQPSYGGQGYQQNYPPQEQRGFFGGSSSHTQVATQPAPPKKSGIGMGTAVLAGGAGLVGGALLMGAFEHHENREREEAYEDGFERGEINNNFDGRGREDAYVEGFERGEMDNNFDRRERDEAYVEGYERGEMDSYDRDEFRRDDW